jgi:hypothetical protein
MIAAITLGQVTIGTALILAAGLGLVWRTRILNWLSPQPLAEADRDWRHLVPRGYRTPSAFDPQGRERLGMKGPR